LESDDDAMDELHRHMFADHAVSVARRVIYMVTRRCPARCRSEPDQPKRPET
jgi:phosphate uptake regulator